MFENTLLNTLHRFYSRFIRMGESLQSIFILYMRLTWGHQFFKSGMGKLSHIDRVIEFFTTIHLSHPVFSAYLVGFTEMICGFLLLVGLASRLAAIPLIITMLVALSAVHSPELTEFRFLLEPMRLVRQEPYPFLLTSLIVFIFGPGKISVDAWIKRWVGRQPRY